MVGVTGLQNRGVEALVRPTVGALTGAIPGSEVTVVTGTPDYDRERCPMAGVEWVADPFLAARSSRVARLRHRWGRRIPALGGQVEGRIAALSGVDGVVATGGDVYSSDYGSFAPHLEPVERVIEAGGKAVFLAQSIGPFRTREEEEVFCRVARRADLITLRETPSYRYCLDKLGLPAGIVKLTADPGFLLEVADGVGALQRLVGLDPDRPYVTLSISQGIAGYGKLSGDEHTGAWTDVVTGLLGGGTQVLLVAHVQRSRMNEDDRIAVTRVARALGWPEGLHLAVGDFSASEMKALISGAQFNLAERMHAAIAGLSTGVPTGVVGYSVKAEGILEDLYGTELAKRAMLPVGDLPDRDKRGRFVAAIAEARTDLADRLEAELPRVKDLARENFRLIGGLFGAEGPRETGSDGQ